MRKWDSNDPTLVQRIESKENNINNSATSEIDPGQNIEEDESFSKSLFDPPCTESEIKVMGMIWNKESDVLKFDFSKLLASIRSEPVTKRLILRTTSQLYDPLGIISPVTVLLKLIFQDFCKAGFGWDEPLPKSIIDRWEDVICDLRSVRTIEIKCHVFKNICNSEIQSLELHVFSDGSSVTFAAAVYLRTELKSDETDTNLMASKARLAPLKGETVPRLELMSALILSRLIITLSNALRSIVKVDDMYCWQDSQITLWWIYGITKEFKQFVQNRLVEIRKLVDFRKWKDCPSEENQSDIPIRGMKLSSLIKDSKWWKGPKFLSKTKEFWPSQLAFDKLENSFEEIKLELKENPRSDFSDVFVNLTCASTFDLENIISCEAYSDLDCLLRVTSYVLRFVNNLKSKFMKCDALVDELQPEEVKYSLGLWCRQAQSTFSEDSGFNRSKSELNVFVDEQGLFRCTGRIQNAPTTHAAKHPILLPRNHHLAKLLVYRAHQNVKQNGTIDRLAGDLLDCKGLPVNETASV